MRERLQRISGWVVWIGGFATGVQTGVYALSAGGAFVVAAFVFLLKETPFSFRAALFVGMFLILFAAINHLIGLVLARRKDQTLPVPAPPEEDTSEIENLRTRLRGVEKERDELKEINEALTTENDELIKAKSVPIEPPVKSRPPSQGGPGIYLGNNTMIGGGTFVRNERDDINIIAEGNKATGIERFLDNAKPALHPSEPTEQPDDKETGSGHTPKGRS